MAGIANAKAKLAWAQKHLETLNAELREFCRPESYGITQYEDIPNQRFVFSYLIPIVPLSISLTVGDVFYNMRSSLDQLVWALARLDGIPGNVQFPITSDTEPKTRKRFLGQLTRVPPDAINAIDKLQPYHRGASLTGHPLWRLNEMCNLDKHRRIPIQSSAWRVDFPQARRDQSGIEVETVNERMIITVPLSRKGEFQVYECAPVEILFGGDSSGIAEAYGGIVEIHDFIAKEVLPNFEGFFS